MTRVSIEREENQRTNKNAAYWIQDNIHIQPKREDACDIVTGNLIEIKDIIDSLEEGYFCIISFPVLCSSILFHRTRPNVKGISLDCYWRYSSPMTHRINLKRQVLVSEKILTFARYYDKPFALKCDTEDKYRNLSWAIFDVFNCGGFGNLELDYHKEEYGGRRFYIFNFNKKK